MEHERLAKVETNVEWLVQAVSKMEPKLDSLLEDKWKRRGVQIATTALFTGIFEIILAMVRH